MKAHKLMEAFQKNTPIYIDGAYIEDEDSLSFVNKQFAEIQTTMPQAQHFLLDYSYFNEINITPLIDTAFDFLDNDIFILPSPITCLTLTDNNRIAPNPNATYFI